MVYEHSPIRLEVCLSQVAMQCETPPRMVMAPTTGATLTPSGMVMLLTPRVAVTPISDGKDTPGKCRDILS